MNTRSIAPQRLPQDAANLELRFGLRVGAALSERSATPGHDVFERLRVAREQALARAREARAALPARQAKEAGSVLVQSQGTLALGARRCPRVPLVGAAGLPGAAAAAGAGLGSDRPVA